MENPVETLGETLWIRGEDPVDVGEWDLRRSRHKIFTPHYSPERG